MSVLVLLSRLNGFFIPYLALARCSFFFFSICREVSLIKDLLFFIFMYLVITPPGFEDVVAREIGGRTLGVHSRVLVDEQPKMLPAIRQIYKIIKQDIKLEDIRVPKKTYLLIKDVPKRDYDYDMLRRKLGANNADSKRVFRFDLLENITFFSELVSENRDQNYQVHTFRHSLKPEIAWCMVRLFSPAIHETIYDPFCQTGTIIIEAALNFGAKYSLLGSDANEEHVQASINNSKKAGVRQDIHFFTHNIHEPLDKPIDFVVSQLPFYLKEKELVPIYKSLVDLGAREYVLLVEETRLLRRAMRGYKLIGKRKVIKGGDKLFILHFTKF